MTPRSLVDSLTRGFLAVAGNPGLILAPLALWVAAGIVIILPLVALAFYFGLALLGGFGAFDRNREGVASFVKAVLTSLTTDGAPWLICLLVLAVALLVVALLAAFVRGGVMSVLLAADLKAPERGRRLDFHVAAAGPLFFRDARRFFGRMFGLFNVYGAGVSVGALVFLAGAAGLLYTAISGGGPWVVGLLLMIAGIPVMIVVTSLCNIALNAASREMVEKDLSLTEAVSQGLALIKRTLGGSVLLYLLLIAVGMAASSVIAAPRFLITVMSPEDRGFAAAFAVVVVLLAVVQMAVSAAAQLVANAAFIAFWGTPRAAIAPALPTPTPGLVPPVAYPAPPA